MTKLVLLVLTAALGLSVGVGIAPGAKPKPCKPKTAKTCKKPAAKKTRPTTTKPTTTATTVPAPPHNSNFNYTFGAGVPDDVRTLVEYYADVSSAYYTKLGLVIGPVNVFAYADAESTAQAYAALFGVPIETARSVWQSSTAVSGDGRIVINAQGWVRAAFTLHIVGHELFHLVQQQLAGSYWRWPTSDAETAPMGPRWLIEGAAELVGWTIAVDAGLATAKEARTDELRFVRNADRVPLEDHESLAGWLAHPQAAYNLYYAAADHLVRSTGQNAFLDFWSAIGKGTEWHAAFQSAFGESVDQFYTEFADYRRSIGG